MSEGRRVTVRMYDVGFGDAFLVTVNGDGDGDGASWRMLVGCGRHPSAAGGPDLDVVVGDIISTCTSQGGRARLDVVVAPNRNLEQVAGFADEAWSGVEVGEVWLPWTADSARGVATWSGPTQPAEVPASVAERASATLLRGFAGDPARRFVRAEGTRRHEVPGIRDAAVHFLAPSAAAQPDDAPSDMLVDTVKLRRDEPPSPPFAAPFRIDPEEFTARYAGLSPSPRLIDSLGRPGARSLAASARSNRAVANTSLVFILVVDGRHLLFPGDALAPVWRQLLADPGVRSLLFRTSLYKVSHHGSRAGTPVDLLQTLPGGVMSLLPVGNLSQRTGFPDAGLVDSLQRTGRLVRSDEHTSCTGEARHPDDLWCEIELNR